MINAEAGSHGSLPCALGRTAASSHRLLQLLGRLGIGHVAFARQGHRIFHGQDFCHDAHGDAGELLPSTLPTVSRTSAKAMSPVHVAALLLVSSRVRSGREAGASV